MRKLRHSWNLTPGAAIRLQHRLRSRVVRLGRLREVRHVAGTDVGFERGGRIARAAVAVLSFPELKLVDYAIARLPARFPYVPGLLSFREMPALLRALDHLRVRPDLLLCDGQGVAHPRRFGIASHLGVFCGIPSIGVAKSRLIGEHGQPLQRRGAWVPLEDNGETIGAVLRTKANTQPVYVSTGHRVSLPIAVRYVMACTTKFRLPETTRWAHRLASGREPFRDEGGGMRDEG
ncbi:MAG: endonuclease V [Betaproteobacteria bacterium RIFCSPLOWO2_02_FULL_67_26]|nr:MAG: endonuclease V [Betaproteobacteria bacterium RIFCSPLOWO2_02_FULL_67_26]